MPTALSRSLECTPVGSENPRHIPPWFVRWTEPTELGCLITVADEEAFEVSESEETIWERLVACQAEPEAE